MVPTFAPDDRLVVWRWGRWSAGDVVALTDPTEPSRLLVKRVSWVRADRVHLQGDNAAASTDSRSFGAVPAGLVVGRVVYRYAPAAEAGAVRRQR
jgi:nickel-type superoxide dismutase maturation protease